ncbi:MAG: hypothetical protein HC892_07075 [Saprospiraceae bacterium]|nr:hypothetical protein [Saprospiraceae bacterium]
MKKSIKKALVFIGFLALTASFSSCNRGYGCPNNFSLESVISNVINGLTK